MNNSDEFLFVEKYRPSTVDDCILPTHIKDVFKSFIENKEFPNLLLHGGPGVGKTTIAKALCNELGFEYLLINASLNANKDALRTDISRFASTMSFSSSGYKVVILDEADYLSHQVQPALRGFIEEFSKNCRFIFTCNFKNKIIGPLRDSRLSNIDFTITKKENKLLMAQFMKRLEYILGEEKIKFDKKVIAELIMKFFPDFRRILNEIQRYGIGGEIDSGILATIGDVDMETLSTYLKDKDFAEMRKWIASSTDLDPNNVFRKIYDHAYEFMNPQSIPMAVLIIAKYQNYAAFVADHEINLAACLTELMMECEFKE